MAPDRVLVVDDEPSLRYVLSTVLGGMGCDVTCAASAEDALPLLDGEPFALALLDIVMPGMNGLELLGILRERSPSTEVVIMTSHASIETAVDAIRKGAYDYLHKPFEIDEVSATAARALEKRRLLERNRELLETTERQNHELTAAVQRLATLNAAGVGFSGRASVQAVLDLFLEIVHKTFDAERVSVMLRGVDEDCLHIVAARGLDAEIIRNTRVRRGEGVAGHVFESGLPILVEDTGADARTQETARADLAPSFMSAPIVLCVAIKSLDSIIGVVNVTNRRVGVAFDHGDAEFLAGLCGQLAVSIERARQTDRLHDAVRILKTAQDRLVSSERINALGEMAAGVAHDFNNILNGILGRAQLGLAAAESGEIEPAVLRSSFTMIETLSRQGADVVRRIQESVRNRRERPTNAVNVNEVVRLGVELIHTRLSGTEGTARGPVEVRCELEEVPPTIGNSLELLQGLSNLMFNALDAMPDGGVITLRTGVEGQWIRLEIADTGVGMTDAVKSTLFQPFHTTKPDGNGLGLSIVHALVTSMGGTIQATSAVTKGTTFTILLPVHTAAVSPPPPLAITPPAEPRRARVLVVDDEPYNLEFYSDCLAMHGHEVIAASCGSEALALFERHAPELVITDLGMPGMTGWDLAAAIKTRDPGLPVIILSGWAGQEEEARAREVNVDLLLAKPIDVVYLLEAVQQTLNAGSQRKCA